ncbi:MAG: ABC transporter ATP-binding protein [bacterium]|nr:ABC transporter ATP-binding protein [bacterium]
MNNGPEHLLDVAGLEVRYGAIEAIRGAGLEVCKGEIVALLGANGAGKSSFLNAIMGLVPLTSGRVLLDGEDIAGEAPEAIVRRGMTLCPEGRRVFANLTVRENLAIGGATRRRAGDAATILTGMLDRFPVLAERHDQMAGTLSGGEQQMLAIARAMMSAPRIVLLDEPSLGLAPRIVDTIFEMIAALQHHGATILLVEQNVDLALDIADRGYVLASGRVALAGPASELLASGDVERAYMGRD